MMWSIGKKLCKYLCAFALVPTGVFVAQAKQAVCFNLSTGEVIIGEVVSRNDNFVEVQNSFSKMTFPSSLIVVEKFVEVPDHMVTEILDSPSAESKKADNIPDEINNTPQQSSAEAWTPLFGTDKSVIGRDDYVYAYLKELREDYHNFVNSFMPEGLKIKFRTGIVSTTSTYTKNSYYFYSSAQKQWDTMSFELDGYYNYEWQENPDKTENLLTDKYGASGKYRWDFLGENSGWYITDIVAYKHDTIKRINRQIDESVGLGYEFELPSWGIKWSVSMGPGFRYIEAHNFDRHMIPMNFLYEELTWDLTELLRFEHKGYFGADLQTGTNGTAYVMVGLVFAPKEIISVSLRFTNDYDTINSPQAIKNENKFMLSVEIPLEATTGNSQ